jgi:ABC-type spermidine/putrescine transport system permease subunit I
MTAIAEHVEARSPVSAPSRRRLVPALLLAPCLAWILFFFRAPLVVMCWRSVAHAGFSFAAYRALFSSPLYGKVMLTTLKTASITTVFAIVLGYPVAYAATISRGIRRGLILMFVFIPYWVDIIVRSFSWLIMLGDNGLINRLFLALGIVRTPLELLYSEFSVLVAMIQILLPLTIVILFGAMLRIDRTLLLAARIHGATGWQAFCRVFFPLSLPGVYGAGLLVFVLALGFYVTPALLGGPRQTMIAQTIMVDASELLDWDQASAAGLVLLVITTLLATLYNRYFSLERLWGGSEP